jgi:hypothetical protein
MSHSAVAGRHIYDKTASVAMLIVAQLRRLAALQGKL